MKAARDFYGGILGCEEGRSSVKWQDYSLHGHQLVCHWAGDDYRCTDYFNPVDGDEVPVPHEVIGPGTEIAAEFSYEMHFIARGLSAPARAKL